MSFIGFSVGSCINEGALSVTNLSLEDTKLVTDKLPLRLHSSVLKMSLVGAWDNEAMLHTTNSLFKSRQYNVYTTES